MKKWILLLLFLTPQLEATTEVTEQMLVSLVEGSPQVESLKGQVQGLNAQIQKVLAGFSPVLESSALYNKTDELSLIIFQPPNQPYYSAEVKMNHNTRYGFSYGVGAKAESLTSQGAMIDSARFNPTVSISMDLLKNRFGSQTNNQVKSLHAQSLSLESGKEALKERVVSEVRKLFWSYNLLVEKMSLNEEILSLTKVLLRDVRKKKRQGFVEAGDYHSVESQQSSQKANILLVKYQLENLKKALKQMLPGLPNDFELTKMKVSDKEKYLTPCLQAIAKRKEAPVELSLFKDQIKESEKSLEYSEQSFKSLNLPELKLFAQYSGAHVDPSFRNTFSDFTSQGEYGYSVGLNLKMSLSGHIKKQQAAELESERFKIKSQNNEVKLALNAVHHEVKASIVLLNEALKEQSKTSNALKKSYQFKKKQYRQARADLLDVLQEQNKFLASRVNQLDITKLIVDTLLNYKSYYHKFTCSGVGL